MPSVRAGRLPPSGIPGSRRGPWTEIRASRPRNEMGEILETRLLANAERGEDAAQQIVGGGFAGDFAERQVG